MFASFDPTHTGFVAEIDGCRCSIEAVSSPIAEQVDWRWTISIAHLGNENGMDPEKFDVLATGETVTPLQASQQIVAWLDAHPAEDDGYEGHEEGQGNDGGEAAAQ
ncbi:hypothetical protein [Burkholderia sp. 22PA0106]|uniref:hypothetical protein n=1 Tax=Burkholderia sp. 22PA0106 TaxID=3237371 RepID=UPI0039C355F6